MKSKKTLELEILETLDKPETEEVINVFWAKDGLFFVNNTEVTETYYNEKLNNKDKIKLVIHEVRNYD